MTTQTVRTRFKLRRDTAADWALANPVLLAGEPGIESDTRKVKYGDGVTNWNLLAYATGGDGLDGTGTAYYGQIGRQASGTVTITASDTYYPIDLPGTFDSDNSYGLIKGAAEGLALKNDTGETQLLVAIGSADVRSANNQVLGLRLAINGVSIAASECRVTTGSTNYGKLLSQWLVELSDGDEVSMHVANYGNTTDITVDRAKLVAFTPGRQGEKGDQGDPGPDGVSIGLAAGLVLALS